MVRYVGIEVDDALEMAERADVNTADSAVPAGGLTKIDDATAPIGRERTQRERFAVGEALSYLPRLATSTIW